MSVFEDVVAIYSYNEKKFMNSLNLQNDIYKTSECDRTDCDIFKFSKPLEEALSDETCCHHQKIVSISQCIKYTNVFSSMFQLSKSENVKAILEELKKKKKIGQSQSAEAKGT